MGKSLFIAEKPSVAREFASALGENTSRRDGYLEGEHLIVTWCLGHLITMSYPEAYDPGLKKWRMDTLPFIPETFRYEVLPNSARQYQIVASLLNRSDVDTIYVCTDSGREGEYIYRLVAQEAGVQDKMQKRVWIDSQTREEILRGIKEARDESDYDHLAASAYLRAKEDYLMGINFSRILSLKYGSAVANMLKEGYSSISVGRVMSCVLGMVVRREREIRDFVKTPFYRVLGDVNLLPESPGQSSVSLGSDQMGQGSDSLGADQTEKELGSPGIDQTGQGRGDLRQAILKGLEWRAVPGSRYENSPLLYKENGFKERTDALGLIEELNQLPKKSLSPEKEEDYPCSLKGKIQKIGRKKEKKNPPLLYNLAEIQNDCSRLFKISPDETLAIIQELYEKKLVTYPRTDARVLSTAVAKEIDKNIRGLAGIPGVRTFVKEILDQGLYKGIAKTRYTDDKKITDHYALIPTGQGLGALGRMPRRAAMVYEIIVRRFLAIFYDPAVYEKLNLTVCAWGESFFASDKYLVEDGYLKVMHYSFQKKEGGSGRKEEKEQEGSAIGQDETKKDDAEEDSRENQALLARLLPKLKKGDPVCFLAFCVKEGETSPPKRYNSGSLILAMENAGQLIEDEELRAQIKSQGIGTSATRAEILNKLIRISYLSLNKKTQIISPTLRGELIFDVIAASMPQMLNAELTASWEKGLTYVAEGTISEDEYMKKLDAFIRLRVDRVKAMRNQSLLGSQFAAVAASYPKPGGNVKTRAVKKKAVRKSGKEG